VSNDLPPDATIPGILDQLIDRVSYVRGVLGNMGPYRLREGSAVVRIGITGEGKAPNYRLECQPGEDGARDTAKDQAFNGSGHKVFRDDSVLREEHWSKQASSFEDIQGLMGRLNRSPRGRK
jgi:hypothetical protein